MIKNYWKPKNKKQKFLKIGQQGKIKVWKNVIPKIISMKWNLVVLFSLIWVPLSAQVCLVQIKVTDAAKEL